MAGAFFLGALLFLGFAAVRLRAAGFFRALFPRVAFARVAFFLLAGAFRFLAAFLATLSPPLIE